MRVIPQLQFTPLQQLELKLRFSPIYMFRIVTITHKSDKTFRSARGAQFLIKHHFFCSHLGAKKGSVVYLTGWSVAHVYRAFGGTRVLPYSLAARVCVQGTPRAVHMGVFVNTVGSVSYCSVFFFLFQFQKPVTDTRYVQDGRWLERVTVRRDGRRQQQRWAAGPL